MYNFFNLKIFRDDSEHELPGTCSTNSSDFLGFALFRRYSIVFQYSSEKLGNSDEMFVEFSINMTTVATNF